MLMTHNSQEKNLADLMYEKQNKEKHKFTSLQQSYFYYFNKITRLKQQNANNKTLNNMIIIILLN